MSIREDLKNNIGITRRSHDMYELGEEETTKAG
jgi:hypothetical protein